MEALRCLELLDTLPEDSFDDIARLAAHICAVPIALVSLIDSDRQWFKARVGLDVEQTPRDLSFCAHALAGDGLGGDGLLVVPDAAADPRFADNPFVMGDPHIRFYAGAPLTTPEGHVLGTLCVLDHRPRALTGAQRDALAALGRMAMTHIELRRVNARQSALMAERERSEQRLRLLESVVVNANDAVVITEAEPISLPGPRIVYVNEAFTRNTGYSPEEVLGKTPRMLHGPASDPAVRAKIRASLEQWKPVRVETKNRRKDGSEFWVDFSIVPVADETGWYTHWVSIQRDVTAQKLASEELERRVEERTAELAAVNASLRAEIADRRALEAERERLLADALERADRDPLTGLLNHRAFHHRLQEEAKRAEREGIPLTLAVLDLDNFKFFNDAYGHLAGDDVLRHVAARLQEVCRPYDVLSRFGGDEFALLVPGAGPTDAQRLEDRLTAHLREQGYRPLGAEAAIPLGVTVGLAVFPEEGAGRLDVLALADARLRRAKSGGRGNTAETVRLRAASAVQGFSMLDALVTAVDNKDRYTRQHSEDVMDYCARIAEALELDVPERETLSVAALLHDVGKIGVPDHILRKPGRLTDEEFAAVKQHPMMGWVMAGAVPGLAGTLGAVRHHHERWDGGGYPDGLCGEATPLAARIMAVADAYSAMTTDRPYRKGMERARALSILRDGAGTQWDPRCVAAFLHALAPSHESVPPIALMAATSS